MNKVFDILRIIPVTINRELTDDAMVRAITLNENIKSTYGYTFKPEDIVKIAKSNTDVWAVISNAIPEVKGQPMYPDFPSQVMDIDEATYRFHQMVHYFSTYGIEDLFGVKVDKGWMPDVDSAEKIKDDKSLFEAKVIEVVEEGILSKVVIERIAQRKQRMTSDERSLVSDAVKNLFATNNSDSLKTLNISFKENLCDIFLCVVDNVSRPVAKDICTSLCQHTGDILKCIKYYLGMHRYKISTSQKKLFVKMLETFPASDFEENIIRSNMKREEVITTLQYLDYNTFSRSSSHKALVSDLRDKKLKSWYAKVEKAFKEDIKNAIKLLSARPGEFLRRMNEALNRGMKTDDIVSNIDATKLSLPTLVRLNTFFDSSEANTRFEKNKFDLSTIARRLLFNYLANTETILKGKKVYIEEGMFDFDNSTIEINERSNMSGYVVSGLAYKIPDEAKIIRFFTYWNDKKRVDIDLHATAVRKDGERIHIGWNAGFRGSGICMSGDVTHSDAAEFIDVDLSDTAAKNVFFKIADYTRFGFNNIEKVLCGVMAVSKLGEEKDYKLYTPKNCFFSNEIKENTNDLYYGYLDVENRIVKFVGKEGNIPAILGDVEAVPEYNFTLSSYLKTLGVAQGVTYVETRDEADVVLRMDKGMEGEISLIDENFFLEV